MNAQSGCACDRPRTEAKTHPPFPRSLGPRHPAHHAHGLRVNADRGNPACLLLDPVGLRAPPQRPRSTPSARHRRGAEHASRPRARVAAHAAGPLAGAHLGHGCIYTPPMRRINAQDTASNRPRTCFVSQYNVMTYTAQGHCANDSNRRDREHPRPLRLAATPLMIVGRLRERHTAPVGTSGPRSTPRPRR